MRAGRASTTAMLVAFWRSLADRGITTLSAFSDPVAHELLGPRWRFVLDRVEWFARRSSRNGKSDFMPWVDALVLRVAYIDAQIEKAAPRQVVILGAGLDTRAWRLQALSGARVFEVDHPASQAYKRERAARLGRPIAELAYVPVDFARDDLEKALVSAGLDASVPTVWIWEGVIMYLDDAALRRTLGSIRGLSAPGSLLVAHYHEPNPSKGTQTVRRLLFRWLGEAQVGLRTSSTMRDELDRAGFVVREDAGADEQGAAVGAVVPTDARLRVSRIMLGA